MQHVRNGHRARNNNVTGGHAQGDKTCLYTYFRGAKALFSHMNLQVTDSVGGGKTMLNISFGGPCPVPPACTCLARKKQNFRLP